MMEGKKKKPRKSKKDVFKIDTEGMSFEQVVKQVARGKDAKDSGKKTKGGEK